MLAHFTDFRLCALMSLAFMSLLPFVTAPLCRRSSTKGIPLLDKPLSQTGQTLMAYTVAEAFYLVVDLAT